MAEQDFNINIRTTADAAGIKVIEGELERLKSKVADTGGLGILGTPDPGIAKVAIAGTIAVIAAVRQANAEQAKLNEALDKQADKLSEIAHKWNEAASGAQSQADVVKLISSELPALEQGQSKLLEMQQQQLSFTQGGVQGMSQLLNLYAQVLALPPFLDPSTYQKSLDQVKKGFADIIKLQEESAIFSFQTAKALADQMDADKLRPTQEVIDEITRSTETLKELQKGITVDSFATLKQYRELGLEIEKNNQRLKELTNTQEKANREAERAANDAKREARETAAEREKDIDFWQKQVQRASPEVQAILKQEQAARTATAEGRERDAALFEKSAEAFKRGATPEQLKELAPLESNKDVVEAINRLADLWK